MRSVSSTNSLVLTEITLSRYCLRTYYRVSTQIPYYHFAIFLPTLECQHFANRPFARYEVYLRPEFISSLSFIVFKIWYSQWCLSNKSPNLNKETKPWGILVVIVKWRKLCKWPMRYIYPHVSGTFLSEYIATFCYSLQGIVKRWVIDIDVSECNGRVEDIAVNDRLSAASLPKIS